jgi:hypothetical protein
VKHFFLPFPHRTKQEPQEPQERLRRTPAAGQLLRQAPSILGSTPTTTRTTSKVQRHMPSVHENPHHCQVAFHTIVRVGALVT